MAIELIAKIKPKNGKDFALVDSEDIQHNESRLADIMPVFLTEAEYEALDKAGKINPKTPYFIKEE